MTAVYSSNSSCVHGGLVAATFIPHSGDIKTSGSESRGQEEAACTRVLGLCDHYSDQDER